MTPSRRSRFILTVLLWGLTLHSLVIAILFGGLGLDADLVRGIAAWKEIALTLVIIAAVVRAVRRDSTFFEITGFDMVVGGMIGVALCYLIAADLILQANLPVMSQFLGFRDAVFFMLLFFVGRSSADLVTDDRFTRKVVAVAVFTSLVAMAERFFVSPDLLVTIGVASYFQDFLNVAEFTAGNTYGLPSSYWTLIGGVEVRRAGSVFLSAQGFAVPMLIFFPAALTWTFQRDRVKKVRALAFAVVCVGLLLTITRVTIAAAFLEVLIFILLRRRPEWAMFTLGTTLFVLVIGLFAVPGLASFVWRTIGWQEASAQSHSAEWVKGLTAFFERPWGWGLGTTDQTAVRANLIPITGDNLYLKYAVEMGVAGVGLLLAIFWKAATTGLRLWRTATSDSARRFGMLVFLATVGIIINAGTASLFNSAPLAWTYFWACGAAVTLAQQAAAESGQSRQERVPGE